MHAPTGTLRLPPAKHRAGWLRRFQRSITVALIIVGLVALAWTQLAILLREAAACGIPVVGSSVDGSCDALLDGQLGALVDPAKPDELMAAIAAAISARQHKARNQLVEIFSIGRFQRRVAEWLSQQTGLAAA